MLQVDLSIYTSSFYTVSSDGYVLINGGTSVGSAAHVHIYGAESSTDYVINIFSVTTKDNFGSPQIMVLYTIAANNQQMQHHYILIYMTDN